MSETQKDFHDFCLELGKLPRITRDFYAFLLERRDEECSSDTHFRFNYNRLKRICSFPNIDEEIVLLSEYGFADMNEPDNYEESPYVRIFTRVKSDHFLLEFVDFTENKNIALSRPIVNLDFSKYGI